MIRIDFWGFGVNISQVETEGCVQMLLQLSVCLMLHCTVSVSPSPCLSNYCCLSMLRQHEGIWPLWLTTTMWGQITHFSFLHKTGTIFLLPSSSLPLTHSVTLLHSASPSPLYSSTKLSLTNCRYLYHKLLTSYLPCLSLLSLLYPHFLSSALLSLNEKLWSVHHIYSTALAYPVGLSILHEWQTHFHTHKTKAHTPL